MSGDPNFIVVILDCARAQEYRESDSADPVATPALDALARKGTTFPRAISPSNWTIPSHFSIYTGTYPCMHGMRTARRWGGRVPTVADTLRRAGYSTALFTENIQLVGGSGVEADFDYRFVSVPDISEKEKTLANSMMDRARFIYSDRFRSLLAALPPLIVPLSTMFHSGEASFKTQATTGSVITDFERWIAARSRTKPYFAFFNLVDTHDPYELLTEGVRLGLLEKAYLRCPRYYLLSVPGFQSLLRWDALVGGYRQSIAAADKKVGRLVRALEVHGEPENTMLVITSDHGQAFGEAGFAYHGAGSPEVVTRVPLVVVPPSGLSVPARVDRWTSLCEIDPWIRSAAAGVAPYDADGRAPLRPPESDLPADVVYSDGSPASDSIRSLRGVCQDRPWNHRLLAAYRRSEKFLLDTVTSEVYRWPDADEADRVSGRRLVGPERDTVRRDIFEAYETIEATRAAEEAKTALAAEFQMDTRLRAWGYD